MGRLLVFTLVVWLTGCATYMPAAVSTNSVGSQFEKPVAIVEGHSSADYYLGSLIGPIGDDSLRAAIDDALKQKKGSTLSNVFVDRQLVCFPFPCEWGFRLFTRVRTIVVGTLVEYKAEGYAGRVPYKEPEEPPGSMQDASEEKTTTKPGTYGPAERMSIQPEPPVRKLPSEGWK